jgi:chemotaxis protein CheZ
MSARRRPFRVEVFDNPKVIQGRSERAHLETHLLRMIDELGELRVMMEKADRNSAEGKNLLAGVEAIQQAILRTRGEIAAIHAKGAKGQDFNRATDELDAVVSDTESATETILGAAESIDAAASQLLRELDGEQKARVQEIHAEAIRIFEACNFQDITGQRIGKVVHLLQFIEERVGTMMEIWSGIAGVSAAEEDVAEEPAGDEALLNGPALAGDSDVVSQDDIDSLFA